MKNNDIDVEDLVTEDDVVETLMDAYEGYTDINEMDTKIQGTFDGLGYLTRNKGFTIRVGTGKNVQEFQITVKER
jgi:hypothetical protein